MAGSEDKFLVRAPSDVSFDGEVWGIEVKQSDGGKKTYMIAGADGKAEASRVANEEARKASEHERGANEAIRQSNEAERKAKDAERDAATKAANTSALAASSAAQSANANAANANTQANAAKLAAQQANAAARLAKPYFIQQAEPPYVDRVNGGMWIQTEGAAVKSINRWDAEKQGAALFPGSIAYPQATTFPAPRGEWSKFAV